jgi:hypothetical protein
MDMVHKPILKEPTGCGFSSFQNGQLNGAYDVAANGSTTNTTSTTTTVFHTLREVSTTVVVQCKKELGAKAEGVLTGTMSMDSLLEFIAAERLRSMPHQGSKWDMVLKWAESLARKVDAFAHAISKFTDQSWEAARLIWGGCWLLLQVCVLGFETSKTLADYPWSLDERENTYHRVGKGHGDLASDGRYP